MIDITEQEIMSGWKHNGTGNPIVSIKCATYNQCQYIGRALESFLCQITSFPFEIVVHDDASTDGTDNIIRDYEKRFPNIIKAIYEKENLYSKDFRELRKVFDSNLKGKYVAICEGDDYWIDNLKLQKQVDFMEANPQCSLCTHNTRIHYIDGSKPDHTFNNWESVKKISQYECFFGWFVHTSSYMYRNEYNLTPPFSDFFWSGDYVYLTVALYYGDVCFLPDIMSVYNANVQTGATAKNSRSTYSKNIEKLLSRHLYLEKYNSFTEYIFDDIVKARQAEIVIKTSDDYSQLINAAKTIAESKFHNEIVGDGKKTSSLKNNWKYKGYVFGPIWYVTVLMKHSAQKRKMK